MKQGQPAKKRWWYVALLGLSLIALGFGMWLLFGKDSKIDVPYLQFDERKVYTYTEAGEVFLYEGASGKQLNEAHLNDVLKDYPYLNAPESIVEEPTEPTVEEVPVKEGLYEFDGFIVVPHTVVKGENVWNIQHTLTPTYNMAVMTKRVHQLNNREDMWWVYPKEVHYFLREKTTQDVGATPITSISEIPSLSTVAVVQPSATPITNALPNATHSLNSQQTLTNKKHGSFYIVEHTVEKGDNSWNIQSALTPEENIFEMLDLVREINPNRDIRWVYPGEVVYYLSKEEAPVVEAPPVAEVVVPPVVQKPTPVKKDYYIYTRGSDELSVYAYHVYKQVMVRITNIDGVLQLEPIGVYQAPNVVSFIENEGAFLFEVTTQKMIASLADNSTLAKVIEKEHSLDVYGVDKDYVYYSQGEYLYRDDIKSTTSSYVGEPIFLGEEAKDSLMHDEFMYIHTSFGLGLAKEVMVQIHLDEWHTENLVELLSDDNRLLAFQPQKGNVYVAQVLKETSLEGETIEQPVILPVKTNGMSKTSYIKNFIPSDEAIVVDTYIYDVEGQDIVTYSTNKAREMGRFTITEKISGYFPTIK